MSVAERQKAHADLVALSVRTGTCTTTTCFQPAAPQQLQCKDCSGKPAAARCVWCGVAEAEKSAFTNDIAISCVPCRIERGIQKDRASRKTSQPTRTPSPAANACQNCSNRQRAEGSQLCAECDRNTRRQVQTAVANSGIGGGTPKNVSHGVYKTVRLPDGTIRSTPRERTVQEKRQRAIELGWLK